MNKQRGRGKIKKRMNTAATIAKRQRKFLYGSFAIITVGVVVERSSAEAKESPSSTIPHKYNVKKVSYITLGRRPVARVSEINQQRLETYDNIKNKTIIFQ